MSLSITWHSSTVILYTLQGKWTWDQMYSGIDTCYEMMDSVSHPVATIFDAREANGLPPNALTNLRNLNRRRHVNSGKVVVIGLSAFHRVILNTFAKLYGFSNPNGVQFVESLTAAEALLLPSEQV